MFRRRWLPVAILIAMTVGAAPASAQALDTTFGDEGTVEFGTTEAGRAVAGMALDTRGRTWLVGQATDGPDAAPWAVLLDRRGEVELTVDPGFLGSHFWLISSVSVLPTGAVVLGGLNAAFEPVFAGLTSEGAVDDEFGMQGVVGPFGEGLSHPHVLVTPDHIFAFAQWGQPQGVFMMAASHEGELDTGWFDDGLAVETGAGIERFSLLGAWHDVATGSPFVVVETGPSSDRRVTVMAVDPDGLAPVAEVPANPLEVDVRPIGLRGDGAAVLSVVTASFDGTTSVDLLSASGPDVTVERLGSAPVLPDAARNPITAEPLRTGGFALVSAVQSLGASSVEIAAFDDDGGNTRFIQSSENAPIGFQPSSSVVDPDTGALTVAAVGATEDPSEGLVSVVTRYLTDESGRYIDDDRSIHQANIEEIERLGVTRGCAPARFCPDDAVTREQMASFLVRALDLASADDSPFTDNDGSVHAADVAALAAAGITSGCAADRYCPDEPVTRGQMASFLVRAFDLEPSDDTPFTDTDGSVHAADIAALAHAGITLGCTASEYCPADPVTRAQMASFLVRALGQAR